jgi:hypothetical protein
MRQNIHAFVTAIGPRFKATLCLHGCPFQLLAIDRTVKCLAASQVDPIIVFSFQDIAKCNIFPLMYFYCNLMLYEHDPNSYPVFTSCEGRPFNLWYVTQCSPVVHPHFGGKPNKTELTVCFLVATRLA